MIYRCTKPGGYVEHLDFSIQFTSDDGTVKPGDTLYDWSQMFIDEGERMGQTFCVGEKSKQLIEKAGFINVVEKKFKLPIGDWVKDKKWKEIGRWNLLFLLEGLDGMQLYILRMRLGVCSPFTRCLSSPPSRILISAQWEFEEIQVMAAKMRQALKDRKNHAYYEV